MAMIRSAVLLSVVFWAPSFGMLHSQSFSMQPEERLKLFATCAGRFEALAGHYSATDNPDLPQTARMLNQFDDLVSAVTPDTVSGSAQAQALRRSAQQKMTTLILSIRLGATQEPEIEANKAFTDELQLCASVLLPTEN